MALLTRFACRRAARVLCPSAFTAGDLRARLGAPPAKLRVTPLGVAPRFFERLSPAELQDFRRRSGLEAPYLLCVGERRPHKNLPGLIEAYARLSAGRQNPPRLAIVGRPYAGYRAPEALVERLGLGERVRFIDYIADADLPALYQAAELFCLLSRYEGFGLPVLEAMASGAPVIAAECGALPEVAGGAARLTPPADPEQTAAALAGLLTGGAERESAIAGGLERARQFTWERCARLTIAAYREALAA
ncbi:MAG: glycosyltransferase family 4 protein [Anaerolineales bacterium]|nr:glycosyltransferase family 4 protein [Anaerolineales bacterium]